MNPYHKQKDSSYDEYEYVDSDSNFQRDSMNNFTGNRVTASGQVRSASHLRSTLPLNPFYGDFIEHIKARNTRKIKEILNEVPFKFYQSVDEMNKTILH